MGSARVAEHQHVYRHPHPAVAVDLAIFTIVNGMLQLLLIERGVQPFKGRWALPGGFVRIDEDLAAAAERELREETGVEYGYLEQIGAFGSPQRDPRERVISVAYFAIIPSPASPARAGGDAQSVSWRGIDELPPLAFDHAAILAVARARLIDRARRTPLALQFLPPEFTLTELQRVHEAILGGEIDKRNFRKWVTDLDYLEPTGRQRRGGQFRPAALYRGVPSAISRSTVDGAATGGLGRAASVPSANIIDATYRRGFEAGVRAVRDRIDQVSRQVLQRPK